jgi:hypothetical protein
VKSFTEKIEENVATTAGSGTLGNRNQQSVATTGNKLRFLCLKPAFCTVNKLKAERREKSDKQCRLHV